MSARWRMFGVRTAILAVAAMFVLAGCASTVSGSAEAVPGAVVPTFTGPPIPVAAVAATFPVTFDPTTGVVHVGASSAKSTLDLYEDLLCPFCGEFEKANSATINQALTAGTISVRYHLLNLLDAESVPPGYSLLAANAVLAVAATHPGAFPSYLNSLFADQPAERGAGYTAAQLIDLGRRLGVTGSRFATMVRRRPYSQLISANLAAAERDPSLGQPGGGGFGTPTVVVNGKVVDWTQPNWLATATG